MLQSDPRKRFGQIPPTNFVVRSTDAALRFPNVYTRQPRPSEDEWLGGGFMEKRVPLTVRFTIQDPTRTRTQELYAYLEALRSLLKSNPRLSLTSGSEELADVQYAARNGAHLLIDPLVLARLAAPMYTAAEADVLVHVIQAA